MRQALGIVFALLLLLPAFTGLAAAQSQQVGGVVTVQEGDTVDGFEAFAGRVVIEGEVDGNLTVFAGRVVITESGSVTGRVRAVGGSVVVRGETGGNVVAYAGEIEVSESGRIGGSFGGIGGGVVIGGEIRNDATAVAGATTIEESARVGGILTYAGAYENRGGEISLGARSVSELSLLPPLTGPGSVLLAVYLLIADAFVGVVLLTMFPGFAHNAADTMATTPQQIVVLGVVALLLTPLAIGAAAITIAGLPLALAGVVGFLILLWLGSIYGRYLLGAMLLSLAGRERRYLALALGIVVAAIFSLVPVVGNLIRGLLVVIGVGALSFGCYGSARRKPRSSGRG